MFKFVKSTLIVRLRPDRLPSSWKYQLATGLGDPGSGAGKGGGGGGAIRNTGGGFGKRQAALEGEYFHKLQKKQLQKLRELLKNEKDPERKAAVEKAKQRIKDRLHAKDEEEGV